VQAVTAAGQSNDESPSKEIERISSRTDAADMQNVENTSKEHSKTELQRLNQKMTQIKVHEITDDCNDYSMKMNMNKQAAKASQTADIVSKSEGRDEVGIEGKFAEVNHQQPQVMRFCPSISTHEVDISLSGKAHFYFPLIQLT